MRRVGQFGKKKGVLYWAKMANSEYLSIIRNALTLTLPIVIAGAAAVFVNNFPVKPYQDMMLGFFGEGWRSFGGYIWNGTLAVLSFATVFTIGYSIAERHNLKNPKDAVHPVIVGLASFCSLLCIIEPASTDFAIPYNWAGVNGLFLSIIVSAASAKLFIELFSIRALRVTFFREDAGATMTHVFSAMIPVTITIGLFALFKVFMIMIGIADIHVLIYGLISRPFKGLGNNLVTALLYNFGRQVLWFVGIHGANALEPVMNEIYVPASAANAMALSAGVNPPFIFTKTFFDTYISMGGAGNTLSLMAALLVTKRRGTMNSLARISFLPAMFNINETLIFGLPIVLNPIYFIPFVVAPLTLTLTTYCAIRLGFLPVFAAEAAWTTPAFVSGYVASGSISGCIMQLVNIYAGFLIYLPFVRIAENAQKYRFSVTYGELLRASGNLDGSYDAAMMHRPGETGSISSVLANDLMESIRENENLLLKNAPGVILMFDLNARFLLGSERASALLGYAEIREMMGIPFAELFAKALPEEWIAAAEEKCARAAWNLESFDWEENVTLRGEQDVVFQIMITPAEERSGVCRGVIVTLNDVTALSKALKQAKKASAAKSDFLSNMSHEMRTPMNAIIGMTAIAKTASEPAKKDYCLDRIEGASRHLLGVINDILDMSKIEANKLELFAEAFDFRKMLENTVNVINYRADEKHQDLTVHIGEDIPRFLIGDDQRIAQVTANLLSNAVKFTPENGIIRLNALKERDDGGEILIRIEVSDTGIGISPEQRSRLFRSFEQADSGTSRKFGGTGLGLAISKRIVGMMGGDILVESEFGKGSTFIFTFRAARVPEEDYPALSRDARDSRGRETETYEGRRVLLVDDVDVNREIVIELLAPALLSIDCAENGAEALAMFEASPRKYDMIFMDIHMPEMDGYEATRRIRALGAPEAKTVPIIAMTANVFREDIEKCLASGMNDHIGKPLKIEEVLEKLRKYLRGKDE
ncbi:MAG: PTS transporter subunit EIIC [Synergistaceae bacterium]|jgi:lactose/cellobiose-specific phosphotransferase system IIC component|nr:PTS transporter subunit EIIC [Synergistaceae bacterium]